MKRLFMIITLVCLIPIANAVWSAIVYVSPNGDDDTGIRDDPAHPFKTIQAGIDAAFDDDTVLVADGEYMVPPEIQHMDFKGRKITVKSENGPKSTIINSGGNPDTGEEHRAFYFHTGEDENSVLDGFTITGGYNGNGAALFFDVGTAPKIINNIITGNEAISNGGAIFCRFDASPTIANNIITNNKAPSNGGAICLNGGPAPMIISNIITDNWAGIRGGGIFSYKSSPTVINNIIAKNEAGTYGGGLCATDGSFPTIIDNTITDNLAGSRGGGIISANGSKPTVLNSILWADTDSEGYNEIIVQSADITVTYSDIQGGWDGEGNIDIDPLFVDPNNGDYHLRDDSPCIGKGTMTGLPTEALTDIDGEPRPAPNGPNPDIGADENPNRDTPLAVSLSVFTAASNGDKVVLNWRTESEVNNLGFNVYRSKRLDGDYVKVTPALIMGAGTEATPREYSFTDNDVVVGNTYYYYIEDVDFSGQRNKSHIIEVTVSKKGIKTRPVSPKFVLLQNYPNPFNPETWIPYQLAQDVYVTIRIRNIKGQLIHSLNLGMKQAGSYITKERAAYWDGRDNLGKTVASGVYFYTLQAGQFTETRKMFILK